METNKTFQCCKKMLQVIVVVLIVNCAIAEELKCENGNCTVGSDMKANQTKDSNNSSENETTPSLAPTVMNIPQENSTQSTSFPFEPTIPPKTTTAPFIFVTVPSSSTEVFKMSSSTSPSLSPSTSPSMTSSMSPSMLSSMSSSISPMTSNEMSEMPVEMIKGKVEGRAINFTLEENHTENGIGPNRTETKSNFRDISDVSMDDEDDDDMHMHMQKHVMEKQKEEMNHTTAPSTSPSGICLKGGLTYSNGEKIEDDCDTVCTCMNGKMDCVDRCTGPYFRRGKKIDDPLCTEKAVDDPCCSILVCAADTETEPLEMCTHQNKTYHRGDKFEDGCAQICTCEAGGKLTCKPRCRPTNKTSDRCVEVPDPSDSCCKMVLCDVDDHEDDHDHEIPKMRIISVKYINNSAILFKFDNKMEDKNNLPDVEISKDKMNWMSYKLMPGGYLGEMKNDFKYARIENTEDYVTIQNSEQEIKDVKKDDTKSCQYEGKAYKVGDQFYKNCTSFCICLDTGIKCNKIKCPTYFGLDVVDPHCIEWETVPKDFTPEAPNCCPKEVRCKSNGSCTYEGVSYQNWQEIPTNVTGCDKRCYCEVGKVECQSACPPVTQGPPPSLPCLPHEAVLEHLPDDDCCMGWMCVRQPPGFGGFPGRFPNIPGPGFQQQSPDEINVQQVDAVDGHTVRLIFTVSPLIVGLHGRVEVRYTGRQDDNIANWELQVFAPPNDLIATQQLEFDLIGLQPNTEYKIKITVILRDLHNTPTSRVYSVRTPAPTAFSTMPPMIPIDPNLAITDANSSWVNVVWRKLSDFELQFVDGVQLRFKEISGKVYAATPLIHRAVTSYTLENLKPDTEYEIGIFFIPFAGQNTELHAENMVHFTTATEIDPYGFNVTLEIQLVKATTVEIAWSGVPYPEDKYVNIYRAIYQSDSGKGDSSTFKIAKRDSPKKTTINDLKPGTRYRLWLEVYLTSGKIKTSNVQDFITKPRQAPAIGAATQQGKLLSSAEIPDHSNDYYGPLVIVAILAAIAILSTLILLMILLRRHSQNKAPISTPTRVSQAAYDNPTYKVEIQQETMGL